MKVCIAEKPSVAGDIAKIIGANQRKDGYYEGNGYQVTWTFGHLCTLKEPHDYLDKWKYWDLRELPMIPSKFGIKLIANQGVEKQFRVIERLLHSADEIINCGDAGQEGEVIQRWVYHKAKATAPTKRLWISSLTEEAIKEGFNNLKDASKYDNLYAAGSTRAIGDWILGMNATRLFTKKFAQQKQVLSIGRVQTPTLAMIVNRQLEIDNFKPEDYWELRTIYRETEFNSVLGKIQKKEKAEYALSKIKEEEFEITSFEQKEGTEKPPHLFDLTSLQVNANRKYGFSADMTLKLIQGLYEKKLVTYPRVDTTYLPDDMYPKIPDILKNLDYYQELTQPLLAEKIKKSNQVFNNKKVTDHHAIIPTGVKMSGVSPDEQKIYDMVVRQFLAAFYPDCKVSNTTVLGEVLKLEFKATGKQILSPGWRVVFPKTKSSEEEKKEGEENIMPVFVKGEKGKHEPRVDQKQTTPPKPYTEATLLRAMETAGKQVKDEETRELMKDNGIGRPSTRANIIETLFRRKYIQRKGKSIEATETGIDLIRVIENETLKSPELTGDWERKLRLIEKGEYQPEQFKKELIEMVVDLTNEVLFNSHHKNVRIIEDKPKEEKAKKTTKKQELDLNSITCPSCKNTGFIKGKSAYGCANYKNGCKLIIPFEFLGKKLTDKQLSDLLIKNETSVIKGFIIPGSNEKKDGKLTLTPDFNITLTEK